MPTPRGLLTPPPSPPQTLPEYLFGTMRSIGVKHGSGPDDGKPLNSISDKQFDSVTPVPYSDYELRHHVADGQRHFSDVRDLL